MSAGFSGINEIPAVIDRRFYEVVSCQASIFKTAAFLKHVGLSIGNLSLITRGSAIRREPSRVRVLCAAKRTGWPSLGLSAKGFRFTFGTLVGLQSRRIQCQVYWTAPHTGDTSNDNASP